MHVDCLVDDDYIVIRKGNRTERCFIKLLWLHSIYYSAERMGDRNVRTRYGSIHPNNVPDRVPHLVDEKQYDYISAYSKEKKGKRGGLNRIMLIIA